VTPTVLGAPGTLSMTGSRLLAAMPHQVWVTQWDTNRYRCMQLARTLVHRSACSEVTPDLELSDIDLTSSLTH
jgi:hypothetical protein